MQHLVDLLLVGLALIASTGYALFALGPKSLRKSAAAAIADLAARAAAIPGLRGPLLRFSLSLANKTQGSCGGCDNCGSEDAAHRNAAHRDAAAESRVPMSKVGLRGGARR